MKEIYSALAKAQAEIQQNSVKKTIQAYNYKYADLGSVWDACKAPLERNNLSVYQTVMGTNSVVVTTTREGKEKSPDSVKTIEEVNENSLRLVTVIAHTSGESISDGGVPLINKKGCMQGLGSAITYARRYGLSSMLGVSPEDDDGLGAGLDNKKSKPYSKPIQKPIQKPSKSDDDFF